MSVKSLCLYYMSGSMPSRACLLLSRILNLDIEIKNVNIPKLQQYSEEFKKINPLSRIPVLVDGDFTLTESRAILGYLVNSRQPGSSLYPQDAKKRAVIDERLYYDATAVFGSLINVIRPVTVEKKKEINSDLKKPIAECLANLNNFLHKSEYFAGSELTIADISILPNVTTAKEMGFNLAQYERLNEWHTKLEELPGFDENLEGAKLVAGHLKYKLGDPIFKD